MNTRTRGCFSFTVLALCAAILALGTVPLAVEAETQSPAGADIVFLIDQSGSMGISDPNRLRFTGLAWAVDYLGRTILEYDEKHAHSFRVAVVHFGDHTHTVLDPTEIAPRSETQWQAEREYLTKQVMYDEGLHADTNFPQAFEAADQVFDNWGASGEINRARVVIVLTDGVSPLYLKRIRELKSYTAAQMPYPAYRIYLVGLFGLGKVPWLRVQEDWEAITQNHMRFVDQPKVLGSYLQTILGEVAHEQGLGATTKIDCGMVFVPPYLDVVRWTLHKPEPGVSVEILDPGGSSIDQLSGVERQGQDALIESISIPDPKPGTWRVTCLQAGVVLFQDGVPVRHQVEMPGERLARGIPYRLTLYLTDHEGKPLTQYDDPKYALQARLTLQPEGTSADQAEDVRLHLDPTLSAYTGIYTPFRLGAVAPSLSAWFLSPEGREQKILTDTLPFMTVLEPQAEVTVGNAEAVQLEPVALQLTLTDDQGVPFVQTTDVLEALNAQLTITEGNENWTVPLALADTGYFSGSFVPYEAGKHALHAQVVRVDPSNATQTVIVDQDIDPLGVEAVRFEVTLDKDLTQLVPASLSIVPLQGTSMADLQLPDMGMVQALVQGLGDNQKQPVQLELQSQGLRGTLLPMNVGGYRPQVILSAQRLSSALPVEVFSQTLEPVMVYAPQIRGGLSEATVNGQCTITATVLGKQSVPYADAVDPDYEVKVVASGGSLATDTPLEYLGGGRYELKVGQAETGAPYQIKVEVESSSAKEILALGDPIQFGECELVKTIGGGPRWKLLAGLGVAALFLALAVGGLVRILRRRGSAMETTGYLQLAGRDGYWAMCPWAEYQERRHTWEPESGSPVASIEIEQRVPASEDAPVGVSVVITYRDGERLDASLDSESPLKLREGFTLKFTESRPDIKSVEERLVSAEPNKRLLVSDQPHAPDSDQTGTGPISDIPSGPVSDLPSGPVSDHPSSPDSDAQAEPMGDRANEPQPGPEEGLPSGPVSP